VRPMLTPKQRAKTVEELLKTVLVRIPPRPVWAANGYTYIVQGATVAQAYTGAIAAPIQTMPYWNYWARGTQTAGSSNLGMLQGRPGTVEFIIDGTANDFGLSLPSHFGNVWWENDIDGIANPLWGQIPVDGTWNGPV